MTVVLLRSGDGSTGSGAARYVLNFFGESTGVGLVTSVNLMGANTDGVDIPLTRGLKTAVVAVTVRRVGSAGLGDWTLRLFKNDVEVATFAVSV